MVSCLQKTTPWNHVAFMVSLIHVAYLVQDFLTKSSACEERLKSNAYLALYQNFPRDLV